MLLFFLWVQFHIFINRQIIMKYQIILFLGKFYPFTHLIFLAVTIFAHLFYLILHYSEIVDFLNSFTFHLT